MNLFAPLVERLSLEVAGLRKALDARPTTRLGTVTGVNPVLRVHLDGDPDPLPHSPSTLVRVLSGDRVMVAHQKRTVTIIGHVGGPRIRTATVSGQTVWFGEHRQSTRTPDGLVTLVGEMTNEGADRTIGASWETIGLIQSNYRPVHTIQVRGVMSTWDAVNVNVSPSGVIQIHAAGAPFVAPTGASFSLGQIPPYYNIAL